MTRYGCQTDILHTSVREQTADCRTLVEFCCGRGDRMKNVAAPVMLGVDIHAPYLHLAQKAHPGAVFLHADALDACHLFADASVDAVLLSDAIEHFEPHDGLALLEESQRIARKRVIVFTPDGFYPQEGDPWKLGGGEWQRHRSGWRAADLKELGFVVEVWPDYHRPTGGRPAFGALFATWETKT